MIKVSSTATTACAVRGTDASRNASLGGVRDISLIHVNALDEKCMMKKSDAQQVLVNAGFVFTPRRIGDYWGDHYALQLDSKWKVEAWAPKVEQPTWGNQLEDEEVFEQDKYEEVTFSLDGKGTRYECKSLAALQQHINHILDELSQVSQNEELLLCPKCRTRYMVAITPDVSQEPEAFLACERAYARRYQQLGAYCDGVSNKLPARIVYS